jgi:hypothetical protein
MADCPRAALARALDDPRVRTNPGRRLVMLAVLRRLWPILLEATLIPTALCYAGLLISGLALGIAAALAWTFIAVGRRLIARRQIPGLLVLSTLGLSIRVAMYLLSENSFVYFLQPIARTALTALLFVGSALLGRPFIARVARDFCSFNSDVEARPPIAALFRRLTYVWAGAQATTAAINVTLLLTVPVSVFVGTAAASAWLVMGLGVAITVADSVRTTRDAGLHTAIAHGGHLHTYVAIAA